MIETSLSGGGGQSYGGVDFSKGRIKSGLDTQGARGLGGGAWRKRKEEGKRGSTQRAMRIKEELSFDRMPGLGAEKVGDRLQIRRGRKKKAKVREKKRLETTTTRRGDREEKIKQRTPEA